MVDAVVVTQVAGSVLLGLGGLGVAAYSTWQTAGLTRESRKQQRLADAYVEALKLAEREGQWVDATVRNFERATWDEYQITKRIVVEDPNLSDRATIAALLAAFGSKAVREQHEKWRRTVSAVEEELEALNWKWDQDGAPDELLPREWLNELVDKLRPQEVTARRELGESVARELGHR